MIKLKKIASNPRATEMNKATKASKAIESAETSNTLVQFEEQPIIALKEGCWQNERSDGFEYRGKNSNQCQNTNQLTVRAGVKTPKNSIETKLI